MARLKITQVKSRIGATERQCKNLDALGLKKINASVEHDDSAIIKGMIERVKHLVKVEEVAVKKAAAPKAKKAEAADLQIQQMKVHRLSLYLPGYQALQALISYSPLIHNQMMHILLSVI